MKHQPCRESFGCNGNEIDTRMHRGDLLDICDGGEGRGAMIFERGRWFWWAGGIETVRRAEGDT